LVETEKSYVKVRFFLKTGHLTLINLAIFFISQHLNSLLEYYLEPLKRETFLSNAEITALFGNIQEIVTFQRQFLQNLEEALELEPDFHKFEHSSQFKVSSFSLSQHKPMPIDFFSPPTERIVCNWISLFVLRKSFQAVLVLLRKSQQGTESATSQ
jgi:hypothetical protein